MKMTIVLNSSKFLDAGFQELIILKSYPIYNIYVTLKLLKVPSLMIMFTCLPLLIVIDLIFLLNLIAITHIFK